MRISCTPKINGNRQFVNGACTKKCKFYEECLKELGGNKPTRQFKEFDPTEKELEAGVGHLNYLGEPKVWKLIKI